MTAGQHDASTSAIGYLYQVNWCLLELLRKAPNRPDSAISLELYDDVSWEENGTPQELLQTKHHLKSNIGLSDKDADIWKTIQVWMDVANPKDPYGPQLVLVSTSIAKDGSAAFALRKDSRDTAKALQLLEQAAKTSKSESTQKVRERYLTLTEAERRVFVSRITVVDGEVSAQDLDDELAQLLYYTLPLGHEKLFLAQLWHWWAQVSLDMLNRNRRSVSAREARQFIGDLRSQFNDDNLPTMVEIADVDEDTVVPIYDSRPFVHQLRWVACNTTNLRKAIVDYHRAITQTTEWLTEDLIGLHELQRFEDNLRDEWSRAWADMREDLGSDADEATKIEVGKKLLRKLRDSTFITVRERYNDQFFSRGKRHELADRGDIGWHPDFQTRLEALLSKVTTAQA
ncbi:ABC-three component system protein [Microbispora sp. ZYX-F-249]|uniref:ABC-three component system protein n=1 Tax=Microbispora maris TaxID=3144104 RepID=A0ABV0AXU4_9ACTN